MEESRNEQIREAVRERYGKIADRGNQGCGCAPAVSGSCCGPDSKTLAWNVSHAVGYSDDDLFMVPEGANLGLGCGNPQLIASLKVGETVLDLGSGGGFDCFLAAKAVGANGHVIGVDMTPEMVSTSRNNALTAGFGNVEFRLGEIEALPVADNTVDVIMSNCVINLSPEKGRVFSEAFRVLKTGGRLAISDIVAVAELPLEMKNDIALYAGCMAGASTLHEIDSMLRGCGFSNIRINLNEQSQALIKEWFPGRGLEQYVSSATIEAIKL